MHKNAPKAAQSCAICFGGCLFGTNYVSMALKAIVRWDSHSDVMATVKYGAIFIAELMFVPVCGKIMVIHPLPPI